MNITVNHPRGISILRGDFDTETKTFSRIYWYDQEKRKEFDVPRYNSKWAAILLAEYTHRYDLWKPDMAYYIHGDRSKTESFLDSLTGYGTERDLLWMSSFKCSLKVPIWVLKMSEAVGKNSIAIKYLDEEELRVRHTSELRSHHYSASLRQEPVDVIEHMSRRYGKKLTYQGKSRETMSKIFYDDQTQVISLNEIIRDNH